MKDNGIHVGAWVANLTWVEVERRIQNRAIGVLPVGAQAKEHGPHLPMNTDWVQAQWFAQNMCKLYNILVWPTLNYGYYPAFREFPGSCSINENTFEQLALDIGNEIINQGVNQLLILNTGISTIPALDRVAAEISGATLMNVYSGAHLRKINNTIGEQIRGGHADEIETSIMLAINSSSVKMVNAESCVSDSIGPGAFVRNDPSHPNYTPSGVFGDPTLASSLKGEQITEAILRDIDMLMRKLDVNP